MGSWRCMDCNEFWPYATLFACCPLCLATTKYDSLSPDYSSEEAKAIVEREAARRQTAKDFESYYTERAVAELQQDVDSWAA